MITATFTPEFAQRILDGLTAGAFDRHLSEAARERLRGEALRSLWPAAAETPTVEVLQVRNGKYRQRMVVVRCCFCGGIHKHLWRPGDAVPGSRAAKCGHGERYEMRATAEQIEREAARRQERQR